MKIKKQKQKIITKLIKKKCKKRLQEYHRNLSEG